MFKAVKHGKVRFGDSLTATEWDEVLHLNEDFLTAAVFSRLVYLPGKTLDAVLPELGEDTGEVQEALFWPNWAADRQEAGQGYAQPDVFLKFGNLDLIVEAKLGDSSGKQDPRQWARYWEAGYRGGYMEPRRPAMLLGVGGLGDKPRSAASALAVEADALVRARFPECAAIRAAGVSWANLYDRLQRLDDVQGTAGAASRAVVQDLKEILGYYGFRPLAFFADLHHAAMKANVEVINDGVVEDLRAWLKPTPDRDWLAVYEALGPIGDSAIRVLAEMDYSK